MRKKTIILTVETEKGSKTVKIINDELNQEMPIVEWDEKEFEDSDHVAGFIYRHYPIQATIRAGNQNTTVPFNMFLMDIPQDKVEKNKGKDDKRCKL